MRRRIRPGRLLLTVFLMAFAVFFGLDLASRGMERVQGPADQAGKPAAVAHPPDNRAAGGAKAGTGPAVQSSAPGKGPAPAGSAAKGAATAVDPAAAKEAAAGPAAKAKASPPGQPGTTSIDGANKPNAASPPRIEMKESFLNHLSNRAGDALRRTARAVVGLIVSFFDAIIS